MFALSKRYEECKYLVQKYHFHLSFPDLLEPIDEREIAEAEVGSLFFFFTFLFEPSLLNEPEAVAVFFSLGGGGVSEPPASK